jgi:hypothetical protein
MLGRADYAGDRAPGARPDGWPAAAGRAYTSVLVWALRCQRVSIGPFERGPVHLAFDAHDNARAPASCGGAPDQVALVLGTFWTDDADLAAYLRDAYAVPAFVSPVREASTDLAGARWTEWSWGPDGAPSSLGLSWATQPASDTPGHLQAFWPAGAGVGRLDLDWSATAPNMPQPVRGAMRPPMLAADFAGIGSWYDGYEASGTLARFRDPGCKEAAA